jgi:hypothetical protein
MAQRCDNLYGFAACSRLIPGDKMTAMGKTTLRITKFLFLAMLVSAMGSVMYLAAERGAPGMRQNALASDNVSSKPLIDTQVPKQVATATFALG